MGRKESVLFRQVSIGPRHLELRYAASTALTVFNSAIAAHGQSTDDRELWSPKDKCGSLKHCKRHADPNKCTVEHNSFSSARPYAGTSTDMSAACGAGGTRMYYIAGLKEDKCKKDKVACKKSGPLAVDCEVRLGSGGDPGCANPTVDADLHLFCCEFT